MKRSLVPLALWLIAVSFLTASGETSRIKAIHPLVRAHAHNDYHHARPLFDALQNGFCNVEADVFLVDGKLLIGHSQSELDARRTLESLYLDPLLDWVVQHDGHVFRNIRSFTLLVDIKTDGAESYLALDTVLEDYQEILSATIEGDFRSGAITVIVSGNRAWDVISSDPTRYVGVDGRLTELSSDRPKHLMPLISDRWSKFFAWSGSGPMPVGERAELRRMVREAHSSGRRLRFWATPDHPSPERTAVWNELVAAGVDLIGTDDLDGLKAFFLSIEDQERESRFSGCRFLSRTGRERLP